MPLRRWMEEHGHPSWYSWMIVVGGNFVTLVLCLTVMLTVNQRSIDRERAARQASERALCGVVSTYVEAQRSAAPTTPYGKKLSENMLRLRRTITCPPR